MTDWQDRPPEPRRDDERDQRDEREPDMSDPEAQRAPGDDQTGGGLPGESPPPMQAGAGSSRGVAPGDAIELDADGIGYDAVGNDNIREGRVGGVMGTPHASRGQGQGG